MRRSIRFGAVLAASTLVLAACGGAGETGGGGGGAPQGNANATAGVTDTSVVIGTHQPLTGPAAPGYSKISVGAKAVFSYINDAGGINGRTIDYRVEDDGYNPAKTVEVVKKLVLQDKVFAIVGGLGTPTHSKVIDYLNSEGVPDLLVSSGALMWDDPAKHPMTFGFQVDYTREGKIQGKYIKDKFGDKKVGDFFQNDDVGRDAQAGLDQFIKAQTVSRQGYDTANTDIGPQISALKSSGAQVVVCSCIPAFAALMILTAAKLDYHPQFVISSIGADPATLSGLLEQFAKQAGSSVDGNALLNGIIGTGYLPGVGMAADPWTTFFKQIHDKYIPKEAFTDTLVFGMAQAYTFAQALKLAGRDLTRQKLVDALASGQIAGPGLIPFGFSKDSHSGYTGALVFTLDGKGKETVLQQPQVTDRGTGDVTAATTARQTPDQVALVKG
jgi:branched-chain amino acid transport system substrate-binding protein